MGNLSGKVGEVNDSVSAYRENVSLAIEQLTAGLVPIVEAKLREAHGNDWTKVVSSSFREDRGRIHETTVDWDAHSILAVMWDQWNLIFRNDLGHFERSLVSELREMRNRWAHQQSFGFDDAFRVLDSVQRLLTAVRASNVDEIRRQKAQLLESHVADEVNSQMQHQAFHRNKWGIIALYLFCYAAIVILGLLTEKLISYAIIAVVSVVVVYLVFQQYRMDPPLLYGPRECRRCHRIIYRKTCPYCEKT